MFNILFQILMIAMPAFPDDVEQKKGDDKVKRDLKTLEALNINDIDLYFPDMKANIDFRTNDIVMVQNDDLYSVGNKEMDKSKIIDRFFMNYQGYRMEVGSEEIRTIGEDIVDRFNIKDEETIKDVRLQVLNVISKYLSKLNESVYLAKSYKARSKLEFQNVLLNLTEANVHLLHSHLLKLLDKVDLVDIDVPSEKLLRIMKKNLQPRKDYDRMAQISFLCKELDFCRSYPGYSDHLADYLEEIFQLKPEKLKEYVNITRSAYNSLMNETFIQKVFFKENVEKLQDWLEKLDEDIKEIKKLRKIIYVVMQTIFRRRIFVKPKYNAKYNRTLAARVLIDMVNKVFETKDQELMSINFSANIGALRKWGSGPGATIKPMLKDLIHFTTTSLKFHWPPEIFNEVQVLTQIMMNGTSDAPESEYLLTDGSQFLKGKIV